MNHMKNDGAIFIRDAMMPPNHGTFCFHDLCMQIRHLTHFFVVVVVIKGRKGFIIRQHFWQDLIMIPLIRMTYDFEIRLQLIASNWTVK